MFQEQGNERALPRLELLAAPVDWAFRQDSSGKIPGANVLEVNLDALGDPLNLFDNGVWQGIGIVPKRVELFLNPGYGFGRGVFPEQLVIMSESTSGFIDRAKKAGFGAV